MLAHGPLILAFSSCAVVFASLLARGPAPPWKDYAVAFVTCFFFFLQLRIADEFKDFAEDSRWRPYRPVPRGLVTLGELRVVFIAGAVIQLGLALWHHPPLVWVLLAAWAYLALMSVEFFARDWLKARPVTYLWTHMLIMPIVDFYATSVYWLPRAGKAPSGLLAFLVASFLNGVVIELGRKLRQPEAEEEGVETYTRLWGVKKAPLAWLVVLVATFAAGLVAARSVGMHLWALAVWLPVVAAAAWAVHRFSQCRTSGKVFEALSAAWTLALYLTLGWLALALHP